VSAPAEPPAPPAAARPRGAEAPRLEVRALLFDTYGTLVDWRGSILEELGAFGAARGIALDWARFLDDWKACYRPGMDAVNRGDVPWTTVDAMYRRRLDALLRAHDIAGVSEAAVLHLNRVWWRLTPWPDTVAGLTRLRTRYVIAPLSNASFAGMVHLARSAGLPWDCVFTAENARRYKPAPEVYLTAIGLLGLGPAETMMVAAHNYDLAAARALGMKTAFVPRPREYGAGQTTDLVPERDWDVVAKDVEELASALGA
jgi:2-haloacid dehalogenase